MRTQSMDTSPEMERVQIELIRKAPITKRFSIMESLTSFIIDAAKQEIKRTHPNFSEIEVALILAERQYGGPLIEKVRAELARRQSNEYK